MRHIIILFSLIACLPFPIQSQCPGAFDCQAAGVLCSIDQLNGFRCANPEVPNSSFPLPNLCSGSGTPRNLNWWAFVGNGSQLTLTFNFDPASCEQKEGIAAGVFEGNCTGTNVWDCNAECNTSTFSLTGTTRNCEVYYVWVDGCNGDVCTYTMSVNGKGGPPLLPPLRPLTTTDPVCLGGTFEVCGPDIGSCDPTIEWSVDGVLFGRNDCIEVNIPPTAQIGSAIRVCVEVTIGNPDNPNAICDQDFICTDFRVDTLEKEIRPPLFLSTKQIPYLWNGIPITSDCVSPPCSIRIQKQGECGKDICQIIRFIQNDSIGYLTGKSYCDVDSNCVKDSMDFPWPNVEITVTDVNGNIFQSITDSLGCYKIGLRKGNYSVSAYYPKDKSIPCPVSTMVTIDTPNLDQTADFFFNKSAECLELQLEIFKLAGRSRPRCDDRQRSILLRVTNPGPTVRAPHEVIVSINDHLKWTPFSSAYNIITPLEASFITKSLQVGESQYITLYFINTCDESNLGEDVCFKASFSPALICNGNPIETEFCDVLLDSYDPNDLTVRTHGVLSPRYIEREERLQGVIRFQNTGTDTAYDVSIDLELDWEKFNIHSFRLTSSDAPVIFAELINNGEQKVRFTLPDIKLPHAGIDSIASIGYIEYYINPKADLPYWTKIEQQAAIYFDANPPIFTNIEEQTIMAPYVFDSIKVELCAGEEYLGEVIIENIQRVDTLVSIGPDTVRTTEITAHPFYYIFNDTIMFKGDSLYDIRINQDTIVTLNLTTHEGCDSTRVYDVEARSTGLNDVLNEHSIYPNPLKANLLYLSWANGENSKFQLMDSNGKVVLEETIDASKSSTLLEGISSGLFLYRWTSSDGQQINGQLIRL